MALAEDIPKAKSRAPMNDVLLKVIEVPAST